MPQMLMIIIKLNLYYYLYLKCFEFIFECSMIDLFFGVAVGLLSCPFLEYCSAVWYSAADTHLKLLDRAVRGVVSLFAVTRSL